MSTRKRKIKEPGHIRLPPKVKARLDTLARHIAEERNKKDVPYHEVVSFLIDKYEESQK
jgi:predicted DNA-binding protein